NLRRARLDPSLDVALCRRGKRRERHALGARRHAGKVPGAVLLDDEVVSCVLFEEHAGGGAQFAGVKAHHLAGAIVAKPAGRSRCVLSLTKTIRAIGLRADFQAAVGIADGPMDNPVTDPSFDSGTFA